MHHITHTLIDVQYIVLWEKWASVVTHTLFDVQYIVPCEKGASVVTHTLFDVQYIVQCEKWASIITHTLFDVQHIVLCEKGASVVTHTLFDVQYIVPYEKWASLITHTLFDVQHIVLCEKGASVVVLSGSQGKGHEAVHLSSYSHSSVEVRSVLTQPLNELCADAALHHSLFSHTRVIAQRQVDKSTVTEHVNMCHLTWSGCSFCCL